MFIFFIVLKFIFFNLLQARLVNKHYTLNAGIFFLKQKI